MATTLEKLSTAQVNNILNMDNGWDAASMAASPQFVRTIENNQEFTEAVKKAEHFMRCLSPMAKHLNVTLGMRNNLVAMFYGLLKGDTVNARGDRKVNNMTVLAMKGYEFNEKVRFQSQIAGQFTAITSAGNGTVVNFGDVGQTELDAPKGATHAQLTVGFTKMYINEIYNDLFATRAKNSKMFKLSEFETIFDNQHIESGTSNDLFKVTYDSTGFPNTISYSGKSLGISTLSFEFFQEVNGQFYQLKDQRYNSLYIADMGVV